MPTLPQALMFKIGNNRSDEWPRKRGRIAGLGTAAVPLANPCAAQSLSASVYRRRLEDYVGPAYAFDAAGEIKIVGQLNP